MVPVEIFSDAAESTGIISADTKTFANLSEHLGVPEQEGWYGVDVAIVRRRAHALGIPQSDTIDPDQLLTEIEQIYYAECLEYFGLSDDNIPTMDVGWQRIAERQRNGAPLDDGLRMETARALQLNKYLTTWEEIHAERQALGLE